MNQQISNSINLVSSMSQSANIGDVCFDINDNCMKCYDGKKWLKCISENYSNQVFSKEELLQWYDSEYCKEQFDSNIDNIKYCKCEDIEFWEHVLEKDSTLIQFIDIKKYPILYQKYVMGEY